MSIPWTNDEPMAGIRSKGFGLVSLCGLLAFTGIVGALHVLRPDYNPMRSFISEYALGPYSFLMTIAFFALGIGSLALLLGLREAVSPEGRSPAGFVFLGLWCAGVLVAGIFPTDPGGVPVTLNGIIHGVAATIALLSLGIGALILARGFNQDARWRSFQRPSFVLGVLILASLAGFFASPSELKGITERIAVSMDIVWLAMTTLKLQSFVVASARQ